MKRILLAILLSATLYVNALAQGTTQTVLPAGFANTAGNDYDSTLDNGGEIQQLFRGTTLQATWATPVRITAISFRVGNGAGSFNTVASSLDIRLSTSSRTPEQMSPAYAVNRGADEVQVFSHSNVALTGSGNQNLNPFDIQFTLDQPFIYDPTKGSLLLYLNANLLRRGAEMDAHFFSSLNSSPVAVTETSGAVLT
jgi:hypothetical protein